MFGKNSQPITLDVIIAKFVPLLGALLFVTGLGYLIYTSVWPSVPVIMRLVLGFFTSFLIIGGAFSFSEKYKYFADVVMGGGVLLLFGTLIYGSRATEVSQIVLPEVATLISAVIFTLIVAYFASLRKSKVILILGMIGVYATPFFIGQNDIWSLNLSFNTYLIYFAAANAGIFLLGREFATHDLVPLNLLGLFVGTTSLHLLVYRSAAEQSHLTFVLLLAIVVLAIWSLAWSSRYFTEKHEEVILSFGYLFPLCWFALELEYLSLFQTYEVVSYGVLALIYFGSWYLLRPLDHARKSHVALYVGGVMALILAFFKWFPDANIYSSLGVSFVSCIFTGMYISGSHQKDERLLASVLFSCIGAIMTLYIVYFREYELLTYPTLFAILGLMPACTLYPLLVITSRVKKHGFFEFLLAYSISSGVIATLIMSVRLFDVFDAQTVFLIIPGLFLITWSFFKDKKDTSRAIMMPIGAVLLTLGYLPSFLYLLSSLAPHVADGEYFFREGLIFSNGDFWKSVLVCIGYFIALYVSRDIQALTQTKRPSFLLVILGYSTLLLLVNFMIITVSNDLNIALTTGGVRAVASTIWWILLAIIMISIGVQKGHGHQSEKLGGLLLLILTILKIALYDLSSMETTKKIIVLMVVGGAMLLFSYFLQVKGYLKSE